MSDRVEIAMDVIVHATEDAGKLYSAFEELFGVGQDSFKAQELEGHFDNPVLVLSAKITNGMAVRVLERISSALSDRERDEILDTLEDRMDGSGLYLRIGKQEFVRGRIALGEENAIRMRIRKPVYRKGEAVREYRNLLNFG